MTKRYAIFSFRNAGPIKSWGVLRAAQVHNSREKPIAHAQSAAAPRHLIGSGNLVQDTKAVLLAHGIDPANLRKNGVLAFEAVLTASHEFFFQHGWDRDQRSKNLIAWVHAQKKFLFTKFDENRVVSLALHIDERTPHLHAVILPLQKKVDARRNDGVERWSLVGRMISGPGQYQQLQNEYAKAMATFGLCRGEPDSGRKHKPVRDYLADIKAKIVAADEERTRARAEFAKAAELHASWAQAKEQLERCLAEVEAEKEKVASAATRIQRTVDVTHQFLVALRDVPAHQLPTVAVALRDQASGIVSGVQAGRLPEGVPVEVQQQWMAWKAGLGR